MPLVGTAWIEDQPVRLPYQPAVYLEAARMAYAVQRQPLGRIVFVDPATQAPFRAPKTIGVVLNATVSSSLR